MLASPTLWPSPATAEAAEPLAWKPAYRRAGLVDGAVIVTGALIYWGDELFVPRRTEPVWRGPVLWDSAVRDALRLEVPGQRDTAARVSDYLFAGSVVHNLLFDNLLIAWAVHGQPEVAFQMTVMDLEAYAVAGALTAVVKTAAGRERPFQGECASDPRYSDLCDTQTAYRAFFSAHATTTAVGAGLLCAHHLHMPLYDGDVVDAGACALGIALTVATGALRIASDRHWSTDVTTGHLVGFASGYLIPTLFYYRSWEGEDAASRGEGGTAWLPFFGPDGAGLQLTGWL